MPRLQVHRVHCSLIAVATMLGLFNSLSIHVSRDVLLSAKKIIQSQSRANVGDRRPPDHEGPATDKAHRGIFLGMLVLAGAIVSIILFFFSLRGNAERGRNNAALIGPISHLGHDSTRSADRLRRGGYGQVVESQVLVLT